MSANRVMELVQKLTEIDTQRDTVRAELGQLLGFSTAAPAPAPAVVSDKPAKQPKSPKAAATPRKTQGQRTVKVVGEDGVERKQPALKNIVLDVITKAGKPLSLAEVTEVITGMVVRKEYLTNAGWHDNPDGTKTQDITAVVSQAINQLQTDDLILGEKDAESKRNRYRLAPPKVA
jgi:hypothetical protein